MVYYNINKKIYLETNEYSENYFIKDNCLFVAVNREMNPMYEYVIDFIIDNISRDMLKTWVKDLDPRLSFVKFFVQYVMYRILNMKYKEITKAFNLESHATVIHGIKVIRGYMDNNMMKNISMALNKEKEKFEKMFKDGVH